MDCIVFNEHSVADPFSWMSFISKTMRLLFAVLNNLSDGLIIMDRHNTIQYFNKAAENITGLPSNEVRGLNRSQAFKNLLHEEEHGSDAFCLPTENHAREFAIRRPNGCLIQYILSSTSLLRDQAGNTIGTLEVFKDVSKRKNLEDDLRLSEKRYRRLFEGSKDMIFITSKDGSIKEVNQASLDLLGYNSKEELQSLAGIEEIYDNPLHWKVFQKQINLHGFVKDFDSNFKKKDGTRIHCLLSGTGVLDDGGEIVGYEGIAKDITARTDAIRNFRQRHLEMRILNSIALVMNKAQDLDSILRTALRKILEALNLSTGAIFLIEAGASFSMRVQQGLYAADPSISPEIEFRDTALMRALLSRDLRLEPEPIFPAFRIAVKTGSNQQWELDCFLITAREKASGFMAFVVPPGRDITSGRDFHLLGSVANFLGGAVQNAGLVQSVRQHREELQRLTAKLYQTLDIERRRIAQDLHDETGQSLMGIRLALESLKRDLSPDQSCIADAIEEVKLQIDQTHQEIRRISYRLHPALLSELGLEPALEAYFDRMMKKTDLNIACTITGFEERLDSKVETTLYRISQEALNNAIRHSKAKHFRLSIVKSYPNIIFVAQDDGVGVNPDYLASKTLALGLVGMRERVHMLNGRFSISSSKEHGTRIRAEIPLQESPHG